MAIGKSIDVPVQDYSFSYLIGIFKVILSESPERYIWASTFISDYNSTKNLVKAG